MELIIKYWVDIGKDGGGGGGGGCMILFVGCRE